MDGRSLEEYTAKAGQELVFEEGAQENELSLETRLAKVLEGDPVLAEQFRTLRARLRSLPGGDGIRTVGLVSASGGEGKTTIATALALVMAQEPGNRVLLVDADLRKPDVERYLGVERSPGLAHWLEHPAAKISVRRLAPYGAFLLGAGQPAERPWELIASPRLGALLAAARRHFDFVVVDCPPLIPVADSALLQDFLDGFLLVVRARSVPREALVAALGKVQKHKVLGVVFNDFRGVISSYYHYGYYPTKS